ncbi:hypothetical protein G9A89_009475 [Geosiphon pyriformis]|nr:hypothetical protein G9A89_009475 [Geosiphon pyriformis]
MPASKSPTEKVVAKEIKKFLADIVQNKEIIIVAGNLNKNLASKSLKKTIATNKEKKYPTATLLQQMNLIDIYRMYAINNPDNTWTSNGVQKILDYVFTNINTVSLVTNIGVINVNELFSTDYKAVKKCKDYKLVKIVIDIIKQIRVNNADMYDNNIMQLLAK